MGKRMNLWFRITVQGAEKRGIAQPQFCNFVHSEALRAVRLLDQPVGLPILLL